jgi:hypothetical protein
MIYPVTFVQENRLIIEEYMWNIGRNIIPFHMGISLLLEGTLNVSALEQSLNLIIERHASLRAAFTQAGNLSASEREIKVSNLATTPAFDAGLYAQYLVDNASLQIQMHFIESLDSEEQDIEVDNILSRSFTAPFDYTRPPFVRADLFQLSCDRHLLVLIVHHFVCDMHGLLLFVRELGIYYDSVVSQSTPRLPIVKRHFLDFALDQNLKAKNNSFDAAIMYWRNQLTRFWPAQPNITDLKPLLLTSGDPMDTKMGAEALPLGVNDLDRWTGFAKTKKISLNMLFIAACMILIKKYANQKDAVAVFSNFSNVTNPDYMNAIGSFVNTHILGIELTDRSTVNDVLSDVRTCVLNGITNQSAPLPLVMHKPERLPALGRGVQILCDMIQSRRGGALQYRTNHITIKQTPPPMALLGNVMQGITIRLWHYGTNAMLTTSFPANALSYEGAFKMLEEIKNIVFWCIDNDKEIVANYKLLNAE